MPWLPPKDSLQAALDLYQVSREAISTAIETYNFLDEIDGAMLPQFSDRLEQAKARCLLIIFKELPVLMDKDDVRETAFPDPEVKE